jgi:arginase family enzyme
MGYRILVDENTSPRVAEILRLKGHTATHVHAKLNEGADDRTILEFARRHEYLLVSHDPDFLDPKTAAGVTVLYYGDDTMDTGDIAERVDTLAEWVPDADALPPVVNIGEW